jgi:hypothetical protein
MNNCGNLHTQILSLYGEDFLKEAQIFENIKIKMAKRVDY